MFVDPLMAPEICTDLEEVMVTKTGTGELDKKNQDRTHHTDAIGYYISKRHPIDGGYRIENKQI